MADYQLIVIGAGPGGYEAALRAAKLGKKVAVVERREAGGTCLNRGCIPTKTLLHASAIYRDAKNGAHCGIHTEDIHADMAEIFAYKRAVSQKLSAGIESLFKTAKIDLLRGTALITGSGCVRVADADGSANDYTCDDILIATGSVPSRPPIPGLELAMTSDELLEGCDRLYDSLVSTAPSSSSAAASSASNLPRFTPTSAVPSRSSRAWTACCRTWIRSWGRTLRSF